MSPKAPEESADHDAVDARIRDAFAAVSLAEDRIDLVCPEPDRPPARSKWAGWALAAATLLTVGTVGGAAVSPWFASGSGLVLQPEVEEPEQAEVPEEWTFALNPLDQSFEVGDVVQIYSYGVVGWDHGVQRIAAIEGDRATVAIVDPEGWNGPPKEDVRLAAVDGPLRIMRGLPLLSAPGQYGVGEPPDWPVEILVAGPTSLVARFEPGAGVWLDFMDSDSVFTPLDANYDSHAPNVDVAACWPDHKHLQVYDADSGMPLMPEIRISGYGTVDGCLSWIGFDAPYPEHSRRLVVTDSVEPGPFVDPVIAARLASTADVGSRVELWAEPPEAPGGDAPIARGTIVRTVRGGTSRPGVPPPSEAIAHVHVSRLDAPAVIRAGTVTARPVRADAPGNKGCAGGPCAP